MALSRERALDPAYWRRKLRKRTRQWARKGARRRFEAAISALGPGDTCIDLGANLGEITARLAATGATVHAFEPDPYAHSRLEARFAGVPNVVLVNAAAGLDDGETALYRATGFANDPEPRSESSSVFADKVNIDKASAFLVPQVDFLRYFVELDRDIAILKIDIEGAEVPILEKLLDHPAAARIGWMFVETHETRIPSLARRTAALRRRAWLLCRPRMTLGWG